MERQQDYMPDFRGEAVKWVLEQGLSMAEAAKRRVVPKGRLANGVASAKGRKVPVVPGGRPVAELKAKVRRLRKELVEVRLERDILIKARGTLPGSRCPVRFHEAVATRVSSGVDGADFGGFTQRILGLVGAAAVPAAREDEWLKVAIRAAHVKARETYGVVRLPPALKAEGFAVGRDRIARLRRERGICCTQQRTFKRTTHCADRALLG